MTNFTQLPSGNWRVQVRRKNRYLSETFRRGRDGEDWALDMERNIDPSGSPSRAPPARPNLRRYYRSTAGPARALLAGAGLPGQLGAFFAEADERGSL